MEQSRNQRSCNINLPEDLVSDEILPRLPVKSLLRFRSVCKHWKSLISSHSFRKLHRERHSSSLPLILTCHDSEYGERLNGFHMKDYYLTAFDLHGNIIQVCTLPISSKSLITLSIPFQSKLLCFVELREKRLFSYNPSTRQLFQLPDPPCFALPNFELDRPTFGYVPNKDEYLLVILVGKNPLGRWVFEVLTFSIYDDDNNFQLHYNEWRSIEVPIMLSNNITLICAGLFVSRFFYWKAYDERDNVSILSFDVETEAFSTFSLPQTTYLNLLEIKDELYAMSESGDYRTSNMWKLCTDKSWTLYKTFNLQEIGFTEADDYFRYFDFEVFAYRLEYLQCYNEPSNVLLQMGMLNLENDVVNEYGQYHMPYYWRVNTHTNLFTL